MANRVEIVRIVFGEKGIAGPEGRVVDPKMLFENLTPPTERAKPFEGGRCRAIIAAQIRQRLFAFEDCRHGLFSISRSICGDVRAIPALRQTDFGGARLVSIRLRPKQRESLQANMRLRLGASRNYWRVHSASSRAQ